MKLPAVTFCLASFPLSSLVASLNLNDSLYNCSIGEAACESNDFYSYKSRDFYSNDIITCYVLNGGRNSSGHSTEIKSTKTTGPLSGFQLRFLLPNDYYLSYYVNDANLVPTSNEIAKFLLPGTANNFRLEKTVVTKLEFPFNNCWNLNNLPDTPLVIQLAKANITYRHVNCVELCFLNFVQKYALEHKLSEKDARGKEAVKTYDKDKNCNQLCPLEYESTQYRISESKYSMGDFTNFEKYAFIVIPGIQKKLNISVSTEEFKKKNLEIDIFLDSLTYTKISQTPKTTLSALVSNLGGSTGLFLDLSFMSACRVVEFILGIIFKF